MRKKNRLLSVGCMGLVLGGLMLLGACGGTEDPGEVGAQEVGSQDGPQDGAVRNYISVSDALEEQHIWFRTFRQPTRDTQLNYTYIFENGKVQEYYTGGIKLTIEDVYDMSNEEIIDHIHEEIPPYDERTGRDRDYTPVEYSLDITLDGSGNNTEEMTVMSDFRFNFDFTLQHSAVQGTVYDTTYTGLVVDYDREEILITRVDHPETHFKLDDPDTQKDNVTIEGS
ncbi:hypothetical protein [Evansella clarkii]|uniref:hypothetical protein n=1 Tax=Evansella clarkii TaxID=79879 RepID=UPI0009967F0D|nr:hypothetical protein [Evansella clarkii]